RAFDTLSLHDALPIYVYIVDGPNTASYAARGYLLALDDYFTDEEMDDWFSASIEEGSYDGRFYSVPYGTSSAGIFYNKAIFEERSEEHTSELQSRENL